MLIRIYSDYDFHFKKNMELKQTTLKNFLNLESESDSSEQSVYIPSPTNGQSKIPDQWSRVMNRERMSHSHAKVFDITKDIDSDRVLKAVRENSSKN